MILIYRNDARATQSMKRDGSVDYLAVSDALRHDETPEGLARRLSAVTTGRIFLISHETDRHQEDPKGIVPAVLTSLRKSVVTPYGRNLHLYVFTQGEAK
jgi:hypothetical protein